MASYCKVGHYYVCTSNDPEFFGRVFLVTDVRGQSGGADCIILLTDGTIRRGGLISNSNELIREATEAESVAAALMGLRRKDNGSRS